ncbi:MAG: 1-acyl-sn-glycerol-3-phosphate acyltransferase [Jiangellaceae bacterium]
MRNLRRWIARALWRLAGWRFAGEAPPSDVGVLVGAPHTTNWDYISMLAISWNFGITPKFLGKHTLFRGPIGYLIRATGGVPVDRANPTGVVRDLVARAEAGEKFLLVVAPEGTREKATYWKSGFYRIAEKTGMPITLGFVDGPTKTVGFGPTFTPSGDLTADMDFVRAFYADKHGVRPQNRTEPRLREEQQVIEQDGTDG